MPTTFPAAMASWLLLVAIGMAAGPRPCAAQPPPSTPDASPQLPALKQLTLEELLDTDVTLPLRRPERVMDVAAAIDVLTAEDIWRSGAVSLPEVFRFAPGLFTARTNAHSWIVTARGFASGSANKLLVMMDGRSVYSPLFSGVFWDQHDTLLADLDRIEVIRGPGASLWGANAVNGVINIVSRSAADTQGTLVSVGGGNEEHAFGAIRHGGRVGTGHYRIYGKATARDQARLGGGRPAGDGHRQAVGGFRVDVGPATGRITLQGDLSYSRADQLAGRDREGVSGNVLARWNRRLAQDADLQLQTYYDRTSRVIPLLFEEVRDTYDLDFQHRFRPAPAHNVTWGASYRISRDDTTATPVIFFDPEDRTTDSFGAFVQDEIALARRVAATLGARVEANDYTGLEFQPTARLRGQLADWQTLWGAVSRAVRLPTRLDTDSRILGPTGELTVVGGADFEAEELVAVEGGYRLTPRPWWSLDASVFRNRYDSLRSQDLPLTTGPIVLGNTLQAVTSGIELILRVQPRAFARVTTGYSFLRSAFTSAPGSRDVTGGATEANDPRHRVLVSLRLDLPRQVDVDTHVRHVSQLPHGEVPAFTDLDGRLGWRASPRVELALVGRNLLHTRRLEFPTAARTRLERAASLHLTTRF